MHPPVGPRRSIRPSILAPFATAVLAACVLGVMLSGCSSSAPGANTAPGNVAITPVAARLAASVGTASALDFGAKTDAARIHAAQYLWTYAGAVRSLSGGQAPSLAQFDAILHLSVPEADPVFARIATQLGQVYASYFPQISAGGPATVLAYLEAIAAGVEDAAGSYYRPGVGAAGRTAPGSPWPLLLAGVPPMLTAKTQDDDEGQGQPLGPVVGVAGGKTMTVGWRTSEFWISAITTAASLLAALGGMLPPKYALIAAAVSSGLYSISRGLAKLG